MFKFYKIFLLLIAFISCSMLASAQNNFFQKADPSAFARLSGVRAIKPSKFEGVDMNAQQMRRFLWSLPDESAVGNRNAAPVLTLPMPGGNTARFHVWESSVQAPGLEAKFPEIKTFAGQGIDDPTATIRFDYSPYFGFRAQILSPVTGRIYIDPYIKGNINQYMSYFQADYRREGGFNCMVTDENQLNIPNAARVNAGPCRGTELRTYRLAIACTAEYAAAVGGGAAGPTHAAIVTSANRITGVYEVELAIRMVLVANNNLIEYLANPDPYSNVIGTADLNANQTNIDAVIGSGNYDIGHLFTSDDNGLAQLSAVCGTGKARGATGSPSLIGDGFDIDYVAHEMGHQFGASHSFNSANCASAGGSYEPGGGTTIMAYAGICAAAENIQPNSDPIFHAISFDQISNFLASGNGGSCGVATATGNTLPVILTMPNNNVSIPIGTPFTLTATASDANGDAITYNWEGWDVGAAGTWVSAASSTTRPLFRTRVSKTTGSRTFPDPRVIAANYPGTTAPSVMDGLRGEVLPTVARPMKFRLTVRDNRAGGGGVVSGGDGCQQTTVFQINAVGTTPFTVSSPNGGESYSGGSTQTVTWNVAGTNAAPVNCANVRISLSTDGGLTFPTVITASTPNDGTEAVTIPSIATTTARIKVEAADNIFFDISNANFTITAPSNSFDFGSPAASSVACGTVTSASATLTTSVSGTFVTPIALTASNVPAGTTVAFSSNPLVPGNSTTVTLNGTNTLASGNYTITVTGTAGAVVRTRDITFTIQAGTPVISSQPASQTLCAGSNATFSVTAAGTNIGYQWQSAPTSGGTYTNIASATGSSYTLNGITTALNNTAYRVVVSGTCPPPATSTAAVLTVIAPPTITTNPTSVTICATGNVTFTGAGAGTGVQYQWQLSTNGGTSYSNIAGATTATLNVPSVTTDMNNYRYRLTVFNSTCTTQVPSTAAILTVNARPTVDLSASPFTNLQPGQTTTLTAAINPSPTGFNITWYRNDAVINGVTGTSFVVDSVKVGAYKVQIVNQTTGCNNESNIVNIGAAASERLFIFPSPNDGRFTVSYYNQSGTSTSRYITVFDSKGAKIYQQRFTIAGPYSLLNVNIQPAARGIYHVVVGDASGKKLVTGKVFVN